MLLLLLLLLLLLPKKGPAAAASLSERCQSRERPVVPTCLVRAQQTLPKVTALRLVEACTTAAWQTLLLLLLLEVLEVPEVPEVLEALVTVIQIYIIVNNVRLCRRQVCCARARRQRFKDATIMLTLITEMILVMVALALFHIYLRKIPDPFTDHAEP